MWHFNAELMVNRRRCAHWVAKKTGSILLLFIQKNANQNTTTTKASTVFAFVDFD